MSFFFLNILKFHWTVLPNWVNSDFLTFNQIIFVDKYCSPYQVKLRKLMVAKTMQEGQ